MHEYNMKRNFSLPISVLSSVLIISGLFKLLIADIDTVEVFEKRPLVILNGPGCNYKMHIIPENPNLGDKAKISFYLETPYRDVPEFRIKFKLLRGAKLISGDLIQIHPALEKGDSAKFSIEIKIVSRILQVRAAAHANIQDRLSGDEWGYCLGAGLIDMVALDKNDTISYEKFGNDPELWSRIGPEYLYDIEAGVRIQSLGRAFDKEAKKIRAEIEKLKKLDPTLSDWDALELMHDVGYGMVWRYGIHKKEESIPILLKARKLMKEEGLPKWEAVDKIVSEIRE